MHVVVMGCGRVGSAIARKLEEIGHSVAVIDQDPEAFRRLGPEFGGRQVTGLGFDRQTLLDAEVDSGAFAAVSSGDNSNIIARGSPARPSASSTSSPASTTPSAPRSTSGWASPASPPCRGR